MSGTLNNITQRVGKSVTIVSRALHDFADVSPDTKAKELGYIPKIHAQCLQSKLIYLISFIMPTFGLRLSNSFFSE